MGANFYKFKAVLGGNHWQYISTDGSVAHIYRDMNLFGDYSYEWEVIDANGVVLRYSYADGLEDAATTALDTLDTTN